MGKRLLNSIAALALVLGCPATADAQQAAPENRFLVNTATFGSSMGDIPDDVVSKRSLYYYNADGLFVGRADYGRLYTDEGYSDDFDVMTFCKAVFNTDGMMTNKDTYQWGEYDGGVFSFRKTQNCESYTYDSDGRLATDTTSMYINEYAYNTDGTLAKKSTYIRDTKKFKQEITYTYTDGVLTHYSSTGEYDSYKFEANIKYDADGNKVEEYQYKLKDGNEVAKQREAWTYTSGALTLYEKFRYDSSGKEIPSAKTEYKPVNGNLSLMDVCSYNYSSNKWTRSGLPMRYEYRDFSGMKEKTAMMIMSATLDKEKPNTVDLRFNVPKAGLEYGCKFVIFRNCIPQDTVDLADVMDHETMQCAYEDDELSNSTYTYFIQPLFAVKDGKIVKPAADSEWVGFYSTTPTEIEVALDHELPAVTNLALVGGEVKNVGTALNPEKEYNAVFGWENPADMNDYGFIKHTLYFVGSNVPENETREASKDTLHVMLLDDVVKAYVVTTYKYGKAFSDTITVKMTDIENGNYTAMQRIGVDGVVRAIFAGNTVQLSEAANVSVYNVSGERVYVRKRTRSVSLAQLPTATYIICVEKDGKQSVYKYHVK